MSSNHIFVPFLNLCRSPEANRAVKPVIHQTKTLIAASLEMYCLRTREAFHAAGHGCGRRHLSEMQRRLLSGAVAHYAAHSARKSLACWRTSLVASELLPLQI